MKSEYTKQKQTVKLTTQIMATIDETMVNTPHYLTKEEADKKYGSKGVSGTALGVGIGGLALSLLSGAGGLLNGSSIFGNSSSSTTATAALAAKEEANAEKSTNRYIEITKDYYQNKIDSLRELTNSFYTLDQKIQAAKDSASFSAIICKCNCGMLCCQILDNMFGFKYNCPSGKIIENKKESEKKTVKKKTEKKPKEKTVKKTVKKKSDKNE